MADYNDEIDLYGDVEESKTTADSGSGSGAATAYNDHSGQNDSNAATSSYSTIPTFISEARGGTGVIPHRDEYGNDNRGSAGPPSQQQRAGSVSNDKEGLQPQRGEYGQPGQWSTKPVSTVRPSDMPEEGLVLFL